MVIEQMGSREAERQGVIEANVKKMKEDMGRFLTNESMSGNADEIDVDGTLYPALAANCYIRPGTAEILEFSNRPPTTRRAVKQISFVVAGDPAGRGFFKIDRIETGDSSNPRDAIAARYELTNVERTILEESVEQWNTWKEQQESYE